MHAQAVVVLVEGDHAIVESMASSGCGHCSSAQGCNSSKKSLLSSASRQFRVRNEARASVGDIVQVSLPDGMVLNGALLMYLLPLLLMIAGAMLGMQAYAGMPSAEMYSALSGFVGLFAGFMAVRRLSSGSRGFHFIQPVITRNAVD